ncbi:MAG: hypothetical protein JWQ42_4823 [Edaphobacter sp.]|nr:hypothetical protein [Edaphobacter sp.]
MAILFLSVEVDILISRAPKVGRSMSVLPLLCYSYC